MKIEKIIIENFKNIERKEIIPKKINLILGANGSGKTSTCEAIRWSLIGDTPKNFIKAGTKEASVSVDIDKIGNIFRYNSGVTKTKINGKNSTAKSALEALSLESNTSQDTMKFMLNSEILNKMTSGELAEFLLINKILPINITSEKFKEYCPGISSSALNELENFFPADCEFGLEELDEAYSYYFNVRKNVKNEIKLKAAKITPMEEDELISNEEFKNIENELIKLRTENEVSLKLKENYNSLLRSYNMQQNNIADCEKQLASLSYISRPNPNLLKTYNEEKLTIQSSINNILSVIPLLEDSIAHNNIALQNLDKPICPLSDKLICNTDKTQIVNDIRTLVHRTETELIKQKSSLEEFKNQFSEVTKKIDRYNEEDKQHRLKLVYQEKLDALRKTLIEQPKQPKEFDNTRYLSLLKTFEFHKENLRKFNEMKLLTEEYNKCLLYSNTIEEVVAALNPKKGIRKAVLDTVVEVMNSHCRDRAKELNSNYDLIFQNEDGMSVYMKINHEDYYYEFNSLSSGQQLIAAFLVIDMINSVSGFKIMMLDNAERLDQSSIEVLLDFLHDSKIEDFYDHIFISFVNHGDIIDIINSPKYDDYCQISC